MSGIDIAVIVACLPSLALCAVTGIDINVAIAVVTLITIVFDMALDWTKPCFAVAPLCSRLRRTRKAEAR